jgi:hypothetical protein
MCPGFAFGEDCDDRFKFSPKRSKLFEHGIIKFLLIGVKDTLAFLKRLVVVGMDLEGLLGDGVHGSGMASIDF